ncbi:hypothetical protein BT96DRAFT_357560 [Gymnopus androsaceus JB14]|uniref:F-box domain-containing protein n=1 Tax=Gymnopus androsaceus JB14 TaxID=1447944 RepID=A0A6A4I6T9_9AGAR|nr:hypothetical protein BT96DRAFT_357560 [Gymnopus androsaceus JB14]
MNHGSGFNALPFELYHLIAQHISDSTSTFCALSRVSKRAYEAFNPILYEKIDTLTLSTLALIEKARLPLIGPHPATFVKSIVLEYPYKNPEYLTRSSLRIYSRDEKAKKERLVAMAPISSTTFLKLALAAINNVIFYGASVKSFAHRCKGLGFSEVFQNTSFSAFSSVECFVIGCSFPTKNLRKSFGVVEELCGPSLTSFELHFA